MDSKRLANLASTGFPLSSTLEEIRIMYRCPDPSRADRLDSDSECVTILTELLIGSCPNVKYLRFDIYWANFAAASRTERLCSALRILDAKIERLELRIPHVSLNVPCFTNFLSDLIENAPNMVYFKILNEMMEFEKDFDRVVQSRRARTPDILVDVRKHD